MTLPIGIHQTCSAALYHSDPAEQPSLSSSIAKTILSKTPRHAWLEHPRLNPAAAIVDEDDKFNLGSVAHELILRKGGGFDICDFDNWQTRAA
jgi:hypothetical protein